MTEGYDRTSNQGLFRDLILQMWFQKVLEAEENSRVSVSTLEKWAPSTEQVRKSQTCSSTLVSVPSTINVLLPKWPHTWDSKRRFHTFIVILAALSYIFYTELHSFGFEAQRESKRESEWDEVFLVPQSFLCGGTLEACREIVSL